MGPGKENGQLVLITPKLPSGFQAKVFKDSVRERVVGCVASLWTFF